MRIFLILVLAGVCIWLGIERQKLKEQNDSLTTQLEEAKKASAVPATPAPAPARSASGVPNTVNTLSPAGSSAPVPSSGNWLDAHVQKGARSLEAPKR